MNHAQDHQDYPFARLLRPDRRAGGLYDSACMVAAGLARAIRRCAPDHCSHQQLRVGAVARRGAFHRPGRDDGTARLSGNALGVAEGSAWPRDVRGDTRRHSGQGQLRL